MQNQCSILVLSDFSSKCDVLVEIVHTYSLPLDHTVQMDVEHGILTTMEKLLTTVCSLSACTTFELDGNSLNVCKELVQVMGYRLHNDIG